MRDILKPRSNAKQDEKIGLTEFSGMSQNSPSNILYCDLDLKITYLNPSSIATLKEIELAGGHRVRITGRYDPDALARLIKGLIG